MQTSIHSWALLHGVLVDLNSLLIRLTSRLHTALGSLTHLLLVPPACKQFWTAGHARYYLNFCASFGRCGLHNLQITCLASVPLPALCGEGSDSRERSNVNCTWWIQHIVVQANIWLMLNKFLIFCSCCTIANSKHGFHTQYITPSVNEIICFL